MTSKKLSKDVIERWPEVFEEINLNVVPLKYLHSIQVRFKDNKVWNIEISKRRDTDWDGVEKQIHEIFATYQDSIDNVDFKLDTEKIKKDIIKETNRFLKKRKLQ
jgi:hypothetical protein